MPKTTTANNENTVNVSYALEISPFLWPKNPDDSANKYENGSNTNSDRFENRNTWFHNPKNRREKKHMYFTKRYV